jgi:hypothetical protein
MKNETVLPDKIVRHIDKRLKEEGYVAEDEEEWEDILLYMNQAWGELAKKRAGQFADLETIAQVAP